MPLQIGRKPLEIEDTGWRRRWLGKPSGRRGYRFQEASLPMVASTGFGSQDSLFEVSFEGLAFAAHKVWPPRLKATAAFPANR